MLIYIVSIVSGIISGMGIGGGTILIPTLIILLNTNQQIAQSVNLLSFIPIGTAALVTHIKNGNVEKRLALKLVIFGISGAIGGSFIAANLSSHLLRKIFAVFLLLMGAYEICCKKK